jgi:hypothetical protein
VDADAEYQDNTDMFGGAVAGGGAGPAAAANGSAVGSAPPAEYAPPYTEPLLMQDVGKSLNDQHATPAEYTVPSVGSDAGHGTADYSVPSGLGDATEYATPPAAYGDEARAEGLSDCDGVSGV